MALRYVFSVPIGPGKQPRLAQTLASLQAQPFEVRVAICHAGPEEEIAEALAPFRHLIAYERHAEDAGQSAAINEGWLALEGDVYGWLNADDALAPNALSQVNDLFSAHAPVDVVCGQSITLDAHDHFTGLHPAVRMPDNDLFRSNTISQPSCFVRREALFAQNLIREDLHYVMDWDLWVRLMSAGRQFVFTPSVLSSTLWDTDTKTAKFNLTRINEIRGVVMRLNSPVTTAKTLIGHMINKIEEYSPISFAFKHAKGLLESGAIRKSAFWGTKNNMASSLWSIDLFHYNACSARGFRFHFHTDSQRRLSLDGVDLPEQSGVTADILTEILPARAYRISIQLPRNGSLSLNYIELL
tara:strand:- start:9134 stop:10201 length:1068 start_codon:yes stop_codon:yes gene_type:complete